MALAKKKKDTPQGFPFSVKKKKRTVRRSEPRTARQKKKLRRTVSAVMAGVAVLAVIFFLWARAQGRLSLTENALGSVLTPIVDGVNSGVRWVRDFFGDLADQQALREENDSLHLENERLQYQLSQLEEAERENQRLLGMLDASETYEALDPIFARVVARDPGLWFDEFIINVGTNDGVEENMAVVTGSGLVGRIYEAGLNYSKVMSIIDTRSSVAVIVERTRGSGMMKGQYMSSEYEGDCYIYYAPVSDVIPGDVIITSGQDGRYPKGIYVGLVKAVSRQSDTSDQYIIVSPGADFQRLEEVLVLREKVETAEEMLPSLPDPTPRPASSPTPAPSGAVTPAPTDDGNFYYPKASPTPGPSPTPAPVMAEDLWSEDE